MKAWFGLSVLACVIVLVATCAPESSPDANETPVLTASVSEVTMASQVDAASRPVKTAGVFLEDISEIYCCALVSDSPESTEISAEWTYKGTEKDGFTIFSGQPQSLLVSGTRYVSFKQVRNMSSWPTGDYEVKLYLDGAEVAAVPFEIEAVYVEPEVRKLLILHIEGWQSGAYYYVSGTVKNVGNVPLYDVAIEATFYDEDGAIIATSLGYLEPNPVGVWDTAHAETEKVTSKGVKYYNYRFILPSGQVVPSEVE